MTISITSGTIFKIIFFLSIAWLAFLLIDLIIILLTAIVIASSIDPFVNRLSKLKVPRIAGVTLVYFILLTIIGWVVYAIIPAVVDESREFASRLPEIASSIQATFIDSTFLSQFFGPDTLIGGPTSLIQNIDGSFIKDSFTSIISASDRLFNAVFTFVLIIVFSFYFSAQNKNISAFISVITPKKYKKYVLNLFERSKEKIGQWAKGLIVLGFIIGVLVYLGLLLLGVPHAFLFAVLAGLFEILPIFGPIVAAIPPLIVAFTDGGLFLMIIVLIFFFVIQQIENHLIYPLVVTQVVGVPSVLVIIAIIIGYTLVGFLGVILAVPIAAVLQEFLKDMNDGTFEKYIGS